MLNELQADYADRGFQVLAISEEEADVIREFVEDNGVEYLNLIGTEEERAHPSASNMGSRMPCCRAASTASGYPASACRAMPMPGSLVRTRWRRSVASAVPSATITCPA